MSDEDAASDEVEAAGWDAIDVALRKVYGDREPQHYGTVVPSFLGGNDPLQGISVFKNSDPLPHYHFITYGFSELYQKETDDPDVSGYGFELTFRLACEADDPGEPPPWVLNFLQNLGRYVFQSGNGFDERHHMSLNGPIAIGQDTDITAITLTLDPELGEIETPNGQVKFLQIIGLCSDEYDMIQQGYFSQVIEHVVPSIPNGITKLERPSILKDRSTLDAITSQEPEVTQRELFGTIVEWDESPDGLRVTLGATSVEQFKSMLKGIVAKGESIAVYGQGAGIVFEAGESVSWTTDDPLLIVTLTEELAIFFAEHLEPTRGDYQRSESDRMVMTVAPVDIRDGEGKIIRTEG